MERVREDWLPWSQKLFTSRGRIGRLEYFIRTFAISLVAVLIFFLPPIIAGTVNHDFESSLVIAQIVSFYPTICQAIKRLHDLGYHGKWVLLFLVPLVSWIMQFVLYFKKGIDGPNEYGADPLRPDDDFDIEVFD